MEENTTQVQQPVPKTPLVGILIALLGIIIFISSFFLNASTLEQIDARVTYASTLKTSKYDSTLKVQTIKVSYTYGNKKFETAINDIVNGNYKKHDEIKIYVTPNVPTQIYLEKESNSTWLIGILFTIIGGATFLGFLDPVIAFVKAFLFPPKVDEDGNPIEKDDDEKKLNLAEVAGDAVGSVMNVFNNLTGKNK